MEKNTGPKQVVIDEVNIRLPAGWQADPVYLARKICEQIQVHASGLHSHGLLGQINLVVKGEFNGNATLAAQKVSQRLQAVCNADFNNQAPKGVKGAL